MFTRRYFSLLVLAAALLPAAAALAQQAPSAAVRLNEPGPENAWLAPRVGTWDVVETVWAAPGATPTVASQNLVAERRLVGSFLQETIHPAASAAAADIKRVDYLSFHRVEGRWKYVSMDTRAPVGIMPAASYGREEEKRINVRFDSFTIPGDGAGVSGQMLRMEQDIIQEDANHDRKDQYFILADGSGKRWLAHRYAYTRRPAAAAAK